ncbi:MAG: ATP-binding cassette domain-containing protein [Firmicutes bacterium]|nr:ATP-binding cassette domain-containing protein [Bacillota bacterium]
MKLEAKNISFGYGNGPEIIHNVSFSLESGQRIGLAADSGYGKTTLCQLLSGYETPKKGEILLDGRPLSLWEKENGGYCPVQLLWQHPEQAVNPRRKMGAVIAEGDGIDQRILEGLGIREEWMERYPGELSGGELQRFCIARALGKRTKFLLADEMTAMLDLITQSEIWTFLLEEVKRRDLGLLVVSHSQALLEKVCESVIDLERING